MNTQIDFQTGFEPMVLFYDGTHTFKGWFDFKMQYIELMDADIHLIFKQYIFAWANAHNKHPKKFMLYIQAVRKYTAFLRYAA